MNVIIVSAADSEYFPLLKGLVLSIIEHRSDRPVAMAALDVGMRPDQVSQLHDLGVCVRTAQWDFEFPQRPTTVSWFKAMTARCCLPRYFPEADVIVWIDADAWLQDWRALHLLVSAALDGSMAIVPEFDKAYKAVLQRFGPDAEYAGTDQDGHDYYAKLFGKDLADILSTSLTYNSGVIALRSDSTAWKAWQKWMQIALDNARHRLTEQSALNAAIYRGEVPVAPLPAWCNWMCRYGGTGYIPAKGIFVSSGRPHDRISILHVTPRSEKLVKATIEGKEMLIPRDYLEHQSFRATFESRRSHPNDPGT